MFLEVMVKGNRPLIIQSDQLVNPFDEVTKAIKTLTNKKTNKTEEDLMKISELEFKGSLYYDKQIGPYLPGWNLHACIRDGAKRTRHGKKVEQGVLVHSHVIPLEYEGPRDLDALWKATVKHSDGEAYPFRYTTSVRINKKARMMRTRPRFQEWSLKAHIILTTSILDRETFEQVLTTAGEQEGIGTYRPRFGRFDVVSVKQVKELPPV